MPSQIALRAFEQHRTAWQDISPADARYCNHLVDTIETIYRQNLQLPNALVQVCKTELNEWYFEFLIQRLEVAREEKREAERRLAYREREAMATRWHRAF